MDLNGGTSHFRVKAYKIDTAYQSASGGLSAQQVLPTSNRIVMPDFLFDTFDVPDAGRFYPARASFRSDPRRSERRRGQRNQFENWN